MVSLMLEYSHLSTPALIIISAIGKTWFRILSFTTTRIILSRVEMGVASLRSNWLPCTTSLLWTHCAGFLTSRWRKLAFVGCRKPAVAGADPDVVHRWHVRPPKFGRRRDISRAMLVSTATLKNVSWSDSRCSTNQGFQGNRVRSTTLPWTRVVERWRCRRQRCRRRQAPISLAGAWSRHRPNDVSPGHNAGWCFQRRCGGSQSYRF